MLNWRRQSVENADIVGFHDIAGQRTGIEFDTVDPDVAVGCVKPDQFAECVIGDSQSGNQPASQPFSNTRPEWWI